MHHVHIHIASKSTLNPARVKQSDRQVTCYSLDAQSIEAPFQSRSVVPENPPPRKKNTNVHRAPHKKKNTRGCLLDFQKFSSFSQAAGSKPLKKTVKL